MRPVRLVAVAAALLAVPVAPAAEPWELLKYTPAGSNSVLTINVQQLLASPRAKKDGWEKLDRTEFLAGAVPVGPNMERVMVAKHLQPGAPGLGGAVAIVPVRSAVDLPQLGAKLGGTTTTVGGEPALQIGNGGLMVALDKSVFGVAWGGNKQQVAGWVRAARASDKSPLNKGLTDTVADIAGKHHICLVVDVDDLFDRNMVVAAVAETKAVQGDPDTAKELETYLTGVVSVTLTADVAADGLDTRLWLNSRALPGKLKPDVVKAFLVELLARNGSTLEDLPTSKGGVSGRSFNFPFRLSDPELAHITHLFLPPLPTATDAASITVAPAGPTAETTVKYLRAVDRQVSELKRRIPNAPNPSTILTWYDSTANALLTTSVLGVDQLAVDYAWSTAGRLRAVADSFRGIPLQLRDLQSKAYLFEYGSGGLFGWNRFANVNTNLPQIRSQQADVIRNDAANREQVWKDIEAHRSDVRGALATKYKKAFD